MRWWGACLLGLVMCVVSSALAAPPSGLDQQALRREKAALITLVEDRLSRAYTITRPGQLPDFATLDELFPSWDGGKPGRARRRWLEQHYTFYKVKYRVYSVRLTSSYTAEIRGERIVKAVREVPFLHWFHRDSERVSRQRFLMEAYRSPEEGWRIRRETLY